MIVLFTFVQTFWPLVKVVFAILMALGVVLTWQTRRRVGLGRLVLIAILAAPPAVPLGLLAGYFHSEFMLWSSCRDAGPWGAPPTLSAGEGVYLEGDFGGFVPNAEGCDDGACTHILDRVAFVELRLDAPVENFDRILAPGFYRYAWAPVGDRRCPDYGRLPAWMRDGLLRNFPPGRCLAVEAVAAPTARVSVVGAAEVDAPWPFQRERRDMVVRVAGAAVAGYREAYLRYSLRGTVGICPDDPPVRRSRPNSSELILHFLDLSGRDP